MSHKDKSRFVSLMTKNTYAMILAGGRGSRLHQLTDWRAKPAVPFGGCRTDLGYAGHGHFRTTALCPAAVGDRG